MNKDYAWIPACGGTEKKFSCRGKWFIYMWNRLTHQHLYYCITDDLFINDDQLSHYGLGA